MPVATKPYTVSVSVAPPPAPPPGASLVEYRIEGGYTCVGELRFADAVDRWVERGTDNEFSAVAEAFDPETKESSLFVSRWNPAKSVWSDWRAE